MLRTILTLVVVVAVVAVVPQAGAASVTSRAKAAVRDEVAATFESSTRVVVTCQRITTRRFKCQWNDRNGPGGATDYFGRGKVTVGKYAGDAKLYQVRCHYCQSGTPRSKGVY